MSRKLARPMHTATAICRGVVTVLVLMIVLVHVFPYATGLAALPRVTHTRLGTAGDPINLLFVGSQQQLTMSFAQAGWLVPDPITAHSTEQIVLATLAHRSYPTAPVSNLYVFGRPQDLAFEKPTSNVATRDHIRIWQTDMQASGAPIWVGQASYDQGIEVSASTHLPTHHIAPTVDVERDTVGAALQHTGLVHEETYLEFTKPIFSAQNAGGDVYRSDGEILAINYTAAPLHLATSGVAPDLRRTVFRDYDMLVTTPSLASIMALVAIIIVALWPELNWLTRRVVRWRAQIKQ